jgi:hypothetical protein
MKMRLIAMLVTGLVLAGVVLTGCVALPASATLATATAPAVPTTVQVPSFPLFGHAADWSWISGRVLPTTQSSACLLLEYDPSNKDSTGGTIPLALPAGASANGFVVVQGAIQPGKGTLCEREERVFVATSADQAAMPVYGHADDYSWLAGQYQITRVQGGCAYITFDPQPGAAPQGGKFVVAGKAEPAGDGSWVILYGKPNPTDPKETCPGASYWADRLELQIAAADGSRSTRVPTPGP